MCVFQGSGFGFRVSVTQRQDLKLRVAKKKNRKEKENGTVSSRLKKKNSIGIEKRKAKEIPPCRFRFFFHLRSSGAFDFKKRANDVGRLIAMRWGGGAGGAVSRRTNANHNSNSSKTNDGRVNFRRFFFSLSTFRFVCLSGAIDYR